MAFDLANFKVLHRIKVGENPDAILYDAYLNRIFVFNGKSKSAVVFDPDSQKILATIPLPGKPEFAVSDGKGKVFVNIEDKNELIKIDGEQMVVLRTYPLSPCTEPKGLSINLAAKKLIVGCDKLAAIVSADSGKVLQTFKVGSGEDATAFDAIRHLAFISAGEGLLTVLREGKSGFEIIQNVYTVKGARTMAVDEKTGRVYLPIALFGPPDPKASGQPRPTIIPDTFALLVVGK